MSDVLEGLRAADVASVLRRLAPNTDVELAGVEAAVLERLVTAGLVTRVADAAETRRALAEKKAQLAVPGLDPSTVGALRSAILGLSEALAMADGAARVQVASAGGPYRGSAARAPLGSFSLTQAGRALLSNLGPRAARAPDLLLTDFQAQLDALDRVLAMRASRATAMSAHLTPKLGATLPAHALRSATLGLASLPHAPDVLAEAFFVLFTGIRQAFARTPSTPEQDASAAESLLLHLGDPRIAYDAATPSGLVAMRDDLALRFCPGRSEDALDATLLLAVAHPEAREMRLAQASAFARAMASREVPTPLSLALLATAAGPADRLVGPAAQAFDALRVGVADPVEALTAAVLAVTQGTHALDAQLARIAEIHGYLMRLAPTGTLVGAALLALLDGEPGGLLDDLRLASKQVQEQRLAPGGVEATTLGLKLLLHSALLARGSEGDPEESLALAVRALPEVAALRLGTQGLGTVSATLPLLTSSVVAFHRPMLDAAVLYAEHQRPMHSDYVFGGWGSGGGGYASGGSRPVHHTQHRSFGWG